MIPRAEVGPLLDALLEAVWIIDARSLRVLEVNEPAVALLGMPRKAMLGHGVTSLVATPEDLAFWNEAHAGTESRILSDSLVRRPDGSVVPVVRRVEPVTFGGQPAFLVAMADRSALTGAEAERDVLVAELRATIESTADGILVTDLAGRIRAFNRRFAAMWGVPEELLNGRDDPSIQAWMRRSVIDAEAYEQRLAALMDASMLQATDLLRLHDGKVIERVSAPQLSRG
jgi:PAS domain S-box-containing protein